MLNLNVDEGGEGKVDSTQTADSAYRVDREIQSLCNRVAGSVVHLWDAPKEVKGFILEESSLRRSRVQSVFYGTDPHLFGSKFFSRRAAEDALFFRNAILDLHRVESCIRNASSAIAVSMRPGTLLKERMEHKVKLQDEWLHEFNKILLDDKDHRRLVAESAEGRHRP